MSGKTLFSNSQREESFLRQPTTVHRIAFRLVISFQNTQIAHSERKYRFWVHPHSNISSVRVQSSIRFDVNRSDFIRNRRSKLGADLSFLFIFRSSTN